MNQPTPEQIEKLPKWAQDWISNLARAHREAVKQVERVENEATPSPISTTGFLCAQPTGGPSYHTRYFRADSIEINHAGVWLSIGLRQNEISLQWSAGHKHSLDDALFTPTSYQAASLRNIKEARK